MFLPVAGRRTAAFSRSGDGRAQVGELKLPPWHRPKPREAQQRRRRPPRASARPRSAARARPRARRAARRRTCPGRRRTCPGRPSRSGARPRRRQRPSASAWTRRSPGSPAPPSPRSAAGKRSSTAAQALGAGQALDRREVVLGLPRSAHTGSESARPRASAARLAASADQTGRLRGTLGCLRSPRKRLAVVTCMDARIDVFRLLGLRAGRRARDPQRRGRCVTDDVIRSLADLPAASWATHRGDAGRSTTGLRHGGPLGRVRRPLSRRPHATTSSACGPMPSLPHRDAIRGRVYRRGQRQAPRRRLEQPLGQLPQRLGRGRPPGAPARPAGRGRAGSAGRRRPGRS